MASGDFQFKGSGGSFLWLSIWTAFLTIITLGLWFPWAVCAVEKWKAKNTYIDDKQLTFKGTGGGLFVTWLLIILLSIITIGIYIPWGCVRVMRWKTDNLYFADAGDNESF